MPIVRGKHTQLRRVTTDDVDRLVAWHADPDVARYWDDETFTHDEMRERLARGDVDAWIVETRDGEPIGYLQTHSDAASSVGQAAAGGSGGLDMFLVPAARGRGLGPDAARAMADHLLASGSHDRVTVDPYEWNQPAIRSWERAGFVEVSRDHPPDEDHTAAWVLMEYRSGR
jgi:aminoglycoside 6'-N-acetyltransferase